MPVLNGDGFCLRPYRRGDEEALARVANNPAIAGNMASIFPNPYTLQDAESWIARCESAPEGELSFAIDIDGIVCGGTGVHARTWWSPYTYEIGYWLGESYWGRGIVTQAAGLVVLYAFDTLGAERVDVLSRHTIPITLSARCIYRVSRWIRSRAASERRLSGAIRSIWREWPPHGYRGDIC